jgi:hypothetical protein
VDKQGLEEGSAPVAPCEAGSVAVEETDEENLPDRPQCIIGTQISDISDKAGTHGLLAVRCTSDSAARTDQRSPRQPWAISGIWPRLSCAVAHALSPPGSYRGKPRD